MFHLIKLVLAVVLWVVVHLIAGVLFALGVKVVCDRVKLGQHGKETEHECKDRETC